MKPKQIGVYTIRTPSGHYYIGSTTRWDHRRYTHTYQLTHNEHPNRLLQEHFTTKDELIFVFQPIPSKALARQREERLIRRCWSDPKFCNLIHPKATKEELANDPDIVEKRRQVLIERLKGTAFQKELDALGMDYSEWRSRQLCESENRQDVVNYLVEIDGKQYRSLSTAAKEFAVAVRTVLNRCKSDASAFLKWKLMSAERQSIPRQDTHPRLGKRHSAETRKKMSLKQREAKRYTGYGDKIIDIHGYKVIIHGATYRSATEASKDLGISLNTVLRRCKNPRYKEWTITSYGYHDYKTRKKDSV